MAQPAIQTSFNSGEWAPALYARVDLAKYHSGAALLRNYFVDYRGGATARPGTKYILQTKSTGTVRLISFQASVNVGYILEFGDSYIRFFTNGAPVLETAIAITSATAASPGVFTKNAHGYLNGDWVYASAFSGGTWSNLNGNYYIVTNKTVNTFELTDLFGTAVSTAGFGVFSAGNTARVYTVTSPYVASELFGIKFAQNVNRMVLCHPNHPPYELILTSSANWTLQAITFGSTVSTPTGGAGATTLGAGSANYAYVVTAVDDNGQESAPTAPIAIASSADIRVNQGSNTISWVAVAGASSYNVYRAEIRFNTAVPSGAAYGYVGNSTGTSFIDSNIEPDFGSGFPQIRNPFSGSGVQNITLTDPGQLYNAVPSVSFTASPGITAQGYATLGAYAASIVGSGFSYAVGDILGIDSPSYGAALIVTGIGPGGSLASVGIFLPGSITGVGTATPTNPRFVYPITGSGVGGSVGVAWRVASVAISNPGTGYLLTPSVSFSGGTPFTPATATAILGAASAGNPTVPQYHQQRLYLMGPVQAPQQLNASQIGAYYNYNISFPLSPSDAFQGSLVAGQQNTIQSAISQPQGLIIFSDRQAWLLNGGSPGSGIDATDPVANAHIFNGAAAIPPIVAVDDILYVQAKGSIVRDLIFDFQKQVYTGKDISVLSSHLFYGYQIVDWAFAEEPFKLIWATRNDGQMLCLTFLKEQELCAWAHSDTQGLFKSVATEVELGAIGYSDATYFVVQRQVAGQTLQYIERLSELYYPNGVSDAWCVDAGLGYNGTATTTFRGAQHLSGLTVTGLADGEVIPPFVMPADGIFTLDTAASKVVVGLAYTPQLTTLPIDLGEPTIQGKMKKINGVTVRVAQTLGLEIGSTFSDLVSMKDLVRGNVGTATNELVTNLVTGDAYTAIDPKWTVPGQYCIQQSYPLPASVLGVIPQIVVGDTKGRQG